MTARRPDDLLHLVRCEGPRVRGWQLRLPAWHPRSEGTRLFSDAAWGGPEAALLAARQARDEAFAAEELPLHFRGFLRHRGNRSGIVGVELKFHPRSKTPSLSAFSWSASWFQDNRQRKQHYYVKALGFDAALQAAVAKRVERTGMSPEPEQVAQAMRLKGAVDTYLATGRWDHLTVADGMTPFARRYEARSIGRREPPRGSRRAERMVIGPECGASMPTPTLPHQVLASASTRVVLAQVDPQFSRAPSASQAGVVAADPGELDLLDDGRMPVTSV